MPTKTNPKLLMLEQFAAVAKALSSAPRLDLLELLAQVSLKTKF